ncbi:putative O-glycosylation ligase, exosortase A system-associated [Aquisalimonas asiatica]|uniref:Probable O-glycosylation ligase, exosortase A-associated n=1 Tax=Aquisalimonas asiatica TaxID=406100 RepID=A0A1H8U4P1_9GAMM|nr:putative O-glycosylation ligase, exosortase A system-associated [Aquisalimonas asiatica]SEO98141.1 probable O-glycosylation ligase, exosortase A-associated [Aquisalimonas asiatica]
MRDIFFFIIIFGSIPLILYRPWFGIIMWYWVGLMNPHRLAWNFLQTMPVAMGVGIATLAALVITRDRRAPPLTRETVVLALFTLHFTITTYFAWLPSDAFSLWEQRIKIVLMTFVTMMLIWGKQRTMAMMAIITLSIAYYGMKGGIHSLSNGFGGMVIGPQGTFIGGNTDIGLAMVMTLPLVLVLARQVHRGEFELPFKLALYDKWHHVIGLGLYGVFWLQIASIIGTHSRGAWVGLAIIFPLLFLGMKRKLTMVTIAFLMIGVVGVAAPDRMINQYESLVNYDEDASAQGRFEAWEVSWNIAVENPLMGTGFGTQRLDPQLWQSYSNEPDPQGSSRAAHSIYFQVLGELGFVGLFLWLSFILFSIFTMLRLRRQGRLRPETYWISEWATALLLGLIGYLISGAFLSLGYFDLFFAMGAAAVIMRRELDDIQAARAKAAVPQQVTVPHRRRPTDTAPSGTA